MAPRRRVRPEAPDSDGYFYPREVCELLRLPEADYRQLRRLFRLVRSQAGAPVPEGWARFSLLDLAAARVAVDLATTSRPGSAPSRLHLLPIERACTALREQGVDNPLLDVPLERHGRRVLAHVKGTLVDPTSGQLALDICSERTRGMLQGDSSVEELFASIVERSRREPRDGGAAIATGVIAL